MYKKLTKSQSLSFHTQVIWTVSASSAIHPLEIRRIRCPVCRINRISRTRMDRSTVQRLVRRPAIVRRLVRRTVRRTVPQMVITWIAVVNIRQKTVRSTIVDSHRTIVRCRSVRPIRRWTSTVSRRRSTRCSPIVIHPIRKRPMNTHCIWRPPSSIICKVYIKYWTP